MEFALYKHNFLTAHQAKAEFNLDQFFHSAFLEKYLTQESRILVIRQSIELDIFDGADLAGDADFVIIEGNLTVARWIDVSHSEYDILGFFVTGNLSAASLTAGDTYITVAGDVSLERYLYCPRPPYDAGELLVRGKLNVPVYLQEDYNPNVAAGEFNCAQRYTIDNDIDVWPEQFYLDSDKQQIDQVDDLVDFILRDKLLPPEQRYFYDWIAVYDLNRHHFNENQRYLITQRYSDEKNVLPGLAPDWLAPRWHEELKALEISDIRIQHLPADISLCTNLEQIKLDNCFSHLQKLPNLLNLKKLRKLEINGSNQDLQLHPASCVSHLRQILSQDFPELDYLSINFWNAAGARWQNGQANQRPALQADDLQGIGRYTQLKVVNFYGNGLSDLPEEFYQLPQLRYIRIIDDLSETCISRLHQQFARQAKIIVE